MPMQRESTTRTNPNTTSTYKFYRIEMDWLATHSGAVHRFGNQAQTHEVYLAVSGV
ncbi:hypothetical protein HQ563_16225 [bacterium]|nr:hypothetical protein [bacterium]